MGKSGGDAMDADPHGGMSMERLTGRKENGHSHIIVVEKCADIEDILRDDYDLSRLRELVKADREGRCVVLPCKVGDKVFQQNGVDIFESQVKKIIYDCGHFAFDEETIGERVFLTRESAEAALKGEQA